MNIWNGQITVEELNAFSNNTLASFLDIKFTKMGDDELVAIMPVTNKTRQPFGLLHGGANVALAETIGSVASWCAVNRELFIGVGVEINANHIKSVTEGIVTGICKPLKIGGKIHIWEIKIYDHTNELSCICRFTCMIVPKRK